MPRENEGSLDDSGDETQKEEGAVAASQQGKRPISYENSGNSHQPVQPTSQISGNALQINQPRSPQRQRQKTLSNTDNVCYESITRKPCNCKRSQCIKLFCSCFASGKFCDELCTCRGCFNRKEYEDKVAKIRDQVKGRNPFAFESTITRVDQGTSSSVRHTRGCNCKKSMCMQKYCECYQATVGCSNLCRCKECKNQYGKKEDYRAIEAVESQRRLEIGSDSKPHNGKEMETNERDLFHYMHHVTPVLQLSNHVQCQPSPQTLERRVILEGNEITNQALSGRSDSISNIYQRTQRNPYANNSVLIGTGWPMTRFGENGISHHRERNNETLYDILRPQMFKIAKARNISS